MEIFTKYKKNIKNTEELFLGYFLNGSRNEF